MKKLRFIKLFESFEERKESEILTEQNLTDLCAKLNGLRLKIGGDVTIGDQIRDMIELLSVWSDEKLNISIPGTEGNVFQAKVSKFNTNDLIEEVKYKLQEILRFCSAGKYYDRIVQETIQGLLQMI